MNACIMQANVDAHFALTIAPSKERALRAHLATCEACRLRYRRRALLAKLDPASPPPLRRIANGLGLRASAERVGGRLPEIALLLALAACVMLFFRAPKEDGFSARGAIDPVATTSAERVAIYRVPQGGQPVRAGDTVLEGDELAFAYDNPNGKPYLMIFAVDERDRVYWFHPAWTDEASDPAAIPIEPGFHELREAVRHRFVGSRIDIHAVFLDKPLTVRQMESELRTSPHSPSEGIDRIETLTILR